MPFFTRICIVGFLAPSLCEAAQSVPLRQAVVDASSRASFGSVVGDVREISGKRLLVNDVTARRLLLLDSTLTSYRVVLDSASGLANSYGDGPVLPVPYLGDSLLLIYRNSQSLQLLGPDGTLGRIISSPVPGDFSYIFNPHTGIDAEGRLIYQARASIPPSQQLPGQTTTLIFSADSAPIVRANFLSRSVDTIGRVRLAGDARIFRSIVDGVLKTRVLANPLEAMVDDWAVVTDGSVAIARGRDYHIDWVDSNNGRMSSPRMQFDWRRLTDSDKAAIIDSVRNVQRQRDSTASSRSAAPARGVTRGGDGRASPNTSTDYVEPGELLDYYPPLRAGSMRADRDNNVWILPTTSAQSSNGALVYDIVNRRGALVERIVMPLGRSLAGFGRGGVVYLLSEDNDGGWVLERAHLSTRNAK